MGPVIAAAMGVIGLGLIAYLIGRATTRSTQRMRGVSDDQRRADDGGPAPYTDYGSSMG